MTVTDMEFTKWLITLGVGGTLAAFMFVFYRKDVRQFTELWKNQTEMLMRVIIDNTMSNQKLVGLIEAQERNVMRKVDIEQMIRLVRVTDAADRTSHD